MNLKQVNFIYSLPFVVIIFTAFSYYGRDLLPDIDHVYLSMATFLFVTLSGFFISNQSNRYRRIVQLVSDFDGTMSYLYRSSSVFGTDAQIKIADILQSHYRDVITHEDWDSYFNHKSTTLTDLNQQVNQLTAVDNFNPAQLAFTERAYSGMADMQKIRKNIITLYQERIPLFQWFLMDFLAIILLIAVCLVPSEGLWFPAVIKGAFAAVIVAVLILLRRLNNFTLFEEMVGRSSAQDVLDIIEGVK